MRFVTMVDTLQILMLQQILHTLVGLVTGAILPVTDSLDGFLDDFRITSDVRYTTETLHHQLDLYLIKEPQEEVIPQVVEE